MPLVRAQDFARRYFQPKLRNDEWLELKRKVRPETHQSRIDRRTKGERREEHVGGRRH